MKSKQLLLFYTLKKKISFLLLISFLSQVGSHLHAKKLNTLLEFSAYTTDSTITGSSQMKMYATESVFIHGLENISIQKVQFIKAVNKTRKKKHAVTKNRLNRKAVKRNYDKVSNQEHSISLYSSDALKLGVWGNYFQIFILSGNYCFKKMGVIKTPEIFLIKKYVPSLVDGAIKYVLVPIISIFLILFRLRPPPLARF